MGLEKIAGVIKSSCKNDESLRKMLLELFQFQLEDRGRWKETYKDIIRKYSKEEQCNDENK